MASTEQTQPTEIGRNPWGVILHHVDWRTLELRWLPVDMSDADFKETITLFAELGEQHHPRWMIIDATEFHHEFGQGAMEWRDENIIPLYGRAGVKKFALPGQTGISRHGRVGCPAGR